MAEIYHSGDKNILALYVGGTLIGYLTSLPTMSASTEYSSGGTPIAQQLFDNMMGVVGGGIAIVEDVVSKASGAFGYGVNPDFEKMVNRVSKAVPDIVGGHLTMEGYSLKGGLMSRKYFLDSGYIGYEFDVVCPSQYVAKAFSKLTDHTMPHVGKGSVASLVSLLAMMTHPSAIINTEGDLGLKGTAMEGVFNLLTDTISEENLSNYVNDTIGEKSILGRSAEALGELDSGIVDSENSENTFRNSGRFREHLLAKFSGKAVAFDSDVDAMLTKLPFDSGAEDPTGRVRDEMKKAYEKKGEKSGILDTAALTGAEIIDARLSLATLPFGIYANWLDKSLVAAPQKLPLESVVVCAVDSNNPSQGKNLFSAIVPTPIVGKGTINIGMKYCLKNFSISPIENLAGDGTPLMYRITLDVQTSQKPTSDDMSFTGGGVKTQASLERSSLDLLTNALKEKKK